MHQQPPPGPGHQPPEHGEPSPPLGGYIQTPPPNIGQSPTSLPGYSDHSPPPNTGNYPAQPVAADYGVPPPKKKYTGVIIASVASFLLLAGMVGGGIAFFLSERNDSEPGGLAIPDNSHEDESELDDSGQTSQVLVDAGIEHKHHDDWDQDHLIVSNSEHLESFYSNPEDPQTADEFAAIVVSTGPLESDLELDERATLNATDFGTGYFTDNDESELRDSDMLERDGYPAAHSEVALTGDEDDVHVHVMLIELEEHVVGVIGATNDIGGELHDQMLEIIDSVRVIDA